MTPDNTHPQGRVPTERDLAFKAEHGVLPWESNALPTGIDLALQHSVTLPPDTESSKSEAPTGFSVSLLLSADGIEFEGAKPVRFDLQRTIRGVKFTLRF
jgi:hypothetical protein